MVYGWRVSLVFGVWIVEEAQGCRTRLRRRSERSSWYVSVSSERGRYLSTKRAMSLVKEGCFLYGKLEGNSGRGGFRRVTTIRGCNCARDTARRLLKYCSKLHSHTSVSFIFRQVVIGSYLLNVYEK